MNIHVCARCEGSGHVTGAYGWEVAWPRWANDPARSQELSLFPPRECPDCAGTGALLEVPAQDKATAWPTHRYTRRGYAEHVAHVLSTQRKKPAAG